MEYKKGFLLMDEPHWITPKILKGIKGDYAVGYNPVDDCDTIEIYEGDETIAFINLNPETDVICIRKDPGRLLNQPYLQRLMTKIYKNFQTHFYHKVSLGSNFDYFRSYDLILNVDVPTYDVEISMVIRDHFEHSRLSILEFDSLEQFKNELQGMLPQITSYGLMMSTIEKKLIRAMAERREMKNVKSLLKSLNKGPIDHSLYGLLIGYNPSRFLIREPVLHDNSVGSFYPYHSWMSVTDTRSDFKKVITDSMSEVSKDAVGVFIESHRLSGSYFDAVDLTK